jgi:hypothetical protein
MKDHAKANRNHKRLAALLARLFALPPRGAAVGNHRFAGGLLGYHIIPGGRREPGESEKRALQPKATSVEECLAAER